MDKRSDDEHDVARSVVILRIVLAVLALIGMGLALLLVRKFGH